MLTHKAHNSGVNERERAMTKVTELEFGKIKKQLRFSSKGSVAYYAKRSLKTVDQIGASKTYSDYQATVKAQHPEINYSLAADVISLHSLVFNKEGYVRPHTAKQAVRELIEEFN